jgi:hypothetical protein
VAVDSGGYLDLLLLQQNVRNAQANLKSQEQTYAQYQELFRGGRLSVVDVDQLFQGVLSARLGVIQSELALQTALDQFKLRLGLPPRLPVEIDDRYLNQFVLTDPAVEQVRDAVDGFERARNDCVHLPGRRKERDVSENRNAGPVKCNALFGRYETHPSNVSLATHRSPSLTSRTLNPVPSSPLRRSPKPTTTSRSPFSHSKSMLSHTPALPDVLSTIIPSLNRSSPADHALTSWPRSWSSARHSAGGSVRSAAFASLKQT